MEYAVAILYVCSTAENISVFVWRQLKEALGEKSGLLYEVVIEETENNAFAYRGEVE